MKFVSDHGETDLVSLVWNWINCDSKEEETFSSLKLGTFFVKFVHVF